MRKRYWIGIGFAAFYVLGQITAPDNSPVAVTQPSSKSVSTLQTETPVSPKLKPVSIVTPTEPDNTAADPLPINQIQFIDRDKVALRTEPSKNGVILDRFQKGRKVVVLATQNDWAKVQDQITQREGWVFSKYLSDQEKAAEPSKAEKKPEPKKETVSVPQIPDSTIIQRIIAESLASYPSSCACPYNTDRRGRRCGGRSAYSRPGGYAPICFPQDVSREMIEAFKSNQ